VGAPTGWQTPKTNWTSADGVTDTDFNRIEGNIGAIETGDRTVDPSQTPSGLTGTLRQFLDWFANRIKAITGKTNWYDAPDTTLANAATHISAAAPHSGHAQLSGTNTFSGLNTFTGSSLFKPSSDSVTAFRIQKSDASAVFDIDTTNKRIGILTESPGYPLDVSGQARFSGQIISTVSTGTAPLSVSSTTTVTNLSSDKVDGYDASASATANTVILRDASGRAKVATPSATDDIATKQYVDSTVATAVAPYSDLQHDVYQLAVPVYYDNLLDSSSRFRGMFFDGFKDNTKSVITNGTLGTRQVSSVYSETFNNAVPNPPGGRVIYAGGKWFAFRTDVAQNQNLYWYDSNDGGNTWTSHTYVVSTSYTLNDAVPANLSDGRVVVAVLLNGGGTLTGIFDPSTSSFSNWTSYSGGFHGMGNKTDGTLFICLGSAGYGAFYTWGSTSFSTFWTSVSNSAEGWSVSSFAIFGNNQLLCYGTGAYSYASWHWFNGSSWYNVSTSGLTHPPTYTWQLTLWWDNLGRARVASSAGGTTYYYLVTSVTTSTVTLVETGTGSSRQYMTYTNNKLLWDNTVVDCHWASTISLKSIVYTLSSSDPASQMTVYFSGSFGSNPSFTVEASADNEAHWSTLSYVETDTVPTPPEYTFSGPISVSGTQVSVRFTISNLPTTSVSYMTKYGAFFE